MLIAVFHNAGCKGHLSCCPSTHPSHKHGKCTLADCLSELEILGIISQFPQDAPPCLADKTR